VLHSKTNWRSPLHSHGQDRNPLIAPASRVTPLRYQQA
jgi:hypothetical protein